MDYGQILRRAWDIIWEHKFLILLGVLVALTNGGNTPSSGASFGGSGSGGDMEPPRDFEGFPEMPDFRDFGIPPVAGLFAVLLIAVAVVVGLAFWVVSTLARGGLIAGVDTITAGATTSFGQAFGAGWQKGWRLLGIGIVPAIPGLIIFVVGLLMAGVAMGVTEIFGRGGMMMGPNIALFAGLACIIVPIALILGLLRTFANRACMIEDLGVFASYKRGWEVLTGNLGEAVVLFLIQIGIGIAIGLLMILPGLLMALCCILWPLLLAIRGAISAYFSTVWTLAWKSWTSTQALGAGTVASAEPV
jgi:hypothetical protein